MQLFWIILQFVINFLFALYWLLVLCSIGLGVAYVSAILYIFVYPMTACLKCLRHFSDILLFGVQFPKYCVDKILEAFGLKKHHEDTCSCSDDDGSDDEMGFLISIFWFIIFFFFAFDVAFFCLYFYIFVYPLSSCIDACGEVSHYLLLGVQFPAYCVYRMFEPCLDDNSRSPYGAPPAATKV